MLILPAPEPADGLLGTALSWREPPCPKSCALPGVALHSIMWGEKVLLPCLREKILKSYHDGMAGDCAGTGSQLNSFLSSLLLCATPPRGTDEEAVTLHTFCRQICLRICIPGNLSKISLNITWLTLSYRSSDTLQRYLLQPYKILPQATQSDLHMECLHMRYLGMAQWSLPSCVLFPVENLQSLLGRLGWMINLELKP